jgi:hypothetical protein
MSGSARWLLKPPPTTSAVPAHSNPMIAGKLLRVVRISDARKRIPMLLVVWRVLVMGVRPISLCQLLILLVSIATLQDTILLVVPQSAASDASAWATFLRFAK